MIISQHLVCHKHGELYTESFSLKENCFSPHIAAKAKEYGQHRDIAVIGVIQVYDDQSPVYHFFEAHPSEADKHLLADAIIQVTRGEAALRDDRQRRTISTIEQAIIVGLL